MKCFEIEEGDLILHNGTTYLVLENNSHGQGGAIYVFSCTTRAKHHLCSYSGNEANLNCSLLARKQTLT